jgi:DNA-binding response OmpR family regulator
MATIGQNTEVGLLFCPSVFMTVSLVELSEYLRSLKTEVVKINGIIEMIETNVLRSEIMGMEGEPIGFSMFKEETRRLLMELWISPNKMLSQEDIRQDVIFDDEASDGAVRHVISRARQALKSANLPYNIENIRGKGYRLSNREVFLNVPKQLKISEK